jgi:hypothetical protein
MIAICAYISFQANGVPVPGYAWQNLFVGLTRTYDSRPHVFQSFRISDSAGARGGDRSQGRLTLNRNQLALNILSEARANQWKLRADVMLCDVTNSTDVRLLSRHLWRLGPIERRSTITVTLNSPLDAIRGDAPRRRLTTDLVGQVPDTGQIFIA